MLIIVIQRHPTSCNIIHRRSPIHRIEETIKKKLKSLFSVEYYDPISSNVVHRDIEYKKL